MVEQVRAMTITKNSKGKLFRGGGLQQEIWKGRSPELPVQEAVIPGRKELPPNNHLFYVCLSKQVAQLGVVVPVLSDHTPA